VTQEFSVLLNLL